MVRKAFWAFLMIIFLLSVSAASVILAEEDTEQYDDEVVVTATRTPENPSAAPGETEVISKKDIETTSSTTVSDVMLDQGQIISSYGGVSGQATLNIDGSSAAQTLILVNGIPANTGVSGTVDLSYFPVAGIQKIEVVHGPLSSLYGANALGGVVNIMTDLTGEPKTDVSLRTGSYQTNQLNMLFQQEQWGVAVGGVFSDGYQIHSKADQSFFMGQYDIINQDDKSLILHSQYSIKNAQTPGYKASYPGNEKNRNFSVDLSGRTHLWSGDWEYKIFRQSMSLEYNTSRNLNDITGFDLAGIYNLPDHQLLGGVMIKKENYNSTASGDHSIDSQGIYLQDTWDVFSNLQIVSGLRWDHNSSFQSPLCPRITLIDKVNNQFTVKAGYGIAYRSPTVSDLYYYDPDPVWPSYGNPNLRPEIGERTDIIGEWKASQHKITLDLYETNLRDGIAWVYDTTPATVANVYKLKINGLNVGWESAWSEEISTRLSYRWLNREKWGDQTQNTSVPDNFFGTNQWDFTFNFHNDPWQCEIRWNFSGDRSPQKAVKMPDYSTLDLNLIYKYNSNTQLFFTANNLFNQQYDINYGYPMPGSEYYLGMRYTF